MNKLELTEHGNNYRLNLQVALKWLFVGGEIKVSSGHRLAMTEDGQLGYRATQTNGATGVSQEILFQCDSDVAWQTLVQHARAMTEKDRFLMAANLALNEQ